MQRSPTQDVLLELNGRVHEAAKRFEGDGPDPERWDFMCECGAVDCRAPVSLALPEYEALRVAGLPVLAPGHAKVVSGDDSPAR